MAANSAWRYRLARHAGRAVTWTAAALTLERMPPFVSASAVVVEDGRVLLVNDPIRREPVLPGGHLHWRETPEAAVIREVQEETGLLVLPNDLLTVVSGEAGAGEPGIIRLVYTATPNGGVLHSSSEGEALWMDLSLASGADSRDAPILRLWSERYRRAAGSPYH